MQTNLQKLRPPLTLVLGDLNPRSFLGTQVSNFH